MIPEEIKEKLAELFADFTTKYPDVKINDLIVFGKTFYEIIVDYMELEDKSVKH